MYTFRASYLGLAALMVVGLLTHSAGAADFIEDFENMGPVNPADAGPSNLIADGWIFGNQSQPQGTENWYQGPQPSGWPIWPPFEGQHYLMAGNDFVAVEGAGSLWAVLPEIAGQAEDSELAFRLRAFPSYLDVLQVRYSPTGNTSTGSSPHDVGNFTQLLFESDLRKPDGQPMSDAWYPIEIAIPGSGRLAIRYYIPYRHPLGSGSHVGIDYLTVQTPSAGPSQPPYPEPGETVTWTSEMNPILISENVTIPETATVIVMPGVVIHFDFTTITVHGEMHLNGEASDPILLRRVDNEQFPWGGITARLGGRVIAQHVDSNMRLNTGNAGFVSVEDSTFFEPLYVPQDTHSQTLPAGVVSTRGTVAVRRSVFDNCRIDLDEAYVLLDDVTLEAGWFKSFRRSSPQTIALDNIEARDQAENAPFQIEGFDAWLGPNNIIENNLWPVRLGGGGLALGSMLPASGNVNNHVFVQTEEIRGWATFANTGLPYIMEFDQGFPSLNGQLEIEPGVHLKFKPNARMSVEFYARLYARGTPTNPIVLEGVGGLWKGITFYVNHYRPQLRYVTVRGAQFGVHSDESHTQLLSSTLEQNQIGGLASTFGTLELAGTRLLNNDIGVRVNTLFNELAADGANGENQFVGNGLGVELIGSWSTAVATNNWWGDPSGPSHLFNPGGQGDSATSSVEVTPFLDAAPDESDHPPLVNLQRMFAFMEEGETVIVNWTAEDDGSIVEHRVLFTPAHRNPPLEIIADNLPGTQRSFEFHVPVPEPTSNSNPAVLRVVAVDDKGREGWDEVVFAIQSPGPSQVEITNDVSNGFTVGESYRVCWSGSSAFLNSWLFLDEFGYAVDLGTGLGCSAISSNIPAVSTDIARFAVYDLGKWVFSETFSIRPPDGLGDAPPSVNLLSPTGGSFGGGTIIPVEWSASDDEALRSFDIQASYNGGRTWHAIVRDLAGTVRTYNWSLPPSEGIDEVLLRVIARDHRFQSSTTAAVSLSITAGSGLVPGDINGDGVVDFDDLDLFVGVLLGLNTDPLRVSLSDLNDDGVADGLDIPLMVAALMNN